MLISFEGLPGAGKSTQAALLARCLAVLWKQRHRREQEFTIQLDRVRHLQR
ncbi:MAG: hypothetical protein ACRDTD_07360 [Pseudonocardiaceae bacterium]